MTPTLFGNARSAFVRPTPPGFPGRAGEQLAEPDCGHTPQLVELHGQADQLVGRQVEQQRGGTRLEPHADDGRVRGNTWSVTSVSGPTGRGRVPIGHGSSDPPVGR
ncbi:MAG: hypothetical protein QOE89_3449, partial [Pseudonocardiales bacterium]|nr:hypothetical protein [Pseudonocardiales bacterium]